ncbi:MAG: sigma-70 family RNA polymerase sigma factor [Succinivibrio sp.]|jgi:RNA polymerase sigma-70 factor (ECF subfamily)|nr:sigma-70 family RNA polymerase sigma factor [Succinivibrio sp.]
MSPKALDANSASDEELVRRVQAGKTDAYNILVVRYQHKVISIAQKFVSDYADASDIAQEAFIKAFRALPNFRGESSFYTWLYRIVTNAAKSFLESSQKQRSQVDVDDEVFASSKLPESLTDVQTPDRIMESEELKQVILKAVSELPAELREAFTLREVEEMSYEEIAAKAGVPIGTVRSRIFRARQSIESRMEQFRKG